MSEYLKTFCKRYLDELDEFMQFSDKTIENKKTFIGNPINAFLLMKLLSKDLDVLFHEVIYTDKSFESKNALPIEN